MIEVAFGSKVSMKNNGYGGGLLHSHVQRYPHGSEQQQVTCYHHKDTNNDWVLHRVREEIYDTSNPHPDPPQFIKNGDVVRLMHEQTGRNLHSHAVAAPVTKIEYEVSCYGNDTIGDSNDYWRVEIVDDVYHAETPYLRSLTTRFRLRHVDLECLLRSHNVNLPQWGFKQAEVVCDRRNRSDDFNIWNVEQHWNPKCK